MAGDAVKAKVNFDLAIAGSLGINGTPTFFDANGKELDWASGDQTKAGIINFFRNYFNKALGRK